MKTIAPGTVIFHRHRGYGVLTTVNLLTGWVAARFGDEKRTLDLNLSTDEIQHADGSAILFRRDPPERMPQARLMAMVRDLHAAGYQKLYLYIWPKASGLHWRWQLFTGTRNWMQRPCREGWYGSGADYIFNPVMGWGDAPGASSAELSQALAQFDPAGLAQALGHDEDHSAWFASVCDALLPDYAYSLGADTADNPLPLYLPVIGVRQRQPTLERQLPYPPGWERTWSPDSIARRHQQRAVVRHDVIPSGWSLPIDF
jgi:hypothetical protein